MRDLNLPVEIRVCPTVRESDGLALSSRNAYLSPQERKQALVLWQSLCRARELVDSGTHDARQILQEMKALYDQHPQVRLDYVALVDPETLLPVQRVEQPVVALVAAWVGQTRLIDNLRIEPS